MQKKQIVTTILTFTFAAILMSLPAQAQRPLIVACPEYPPWKIIHEDGTFGGIDIELIREIAKRLELPVVFQEMTWHRAVYMLKTGEVDMLSNMFKSAEREKFVHFLAPPYRRESRVAFYVPKGEEKRIRRYEDLLRLRIGTIKGILYFPRFDKDTRLDKKPVMAELQNPTKLLHGHIDTFVETEVAGDWTIKQSGLSGKIVKAEYIHVKKKPVYLVLSKNSPYSTLLDDFNLTLKNLIQEGTVQRIIDRHCSKAGNMQAKS